MGHTCSLGGIPKEHSGCLTDGTVTLTINRLFVAVSRVVGMDTVAVACFDGFDELDAIGPYEVFQNAARFGASWDVTLRSVRESDTVTASHGLRVEPDGSLADVTLDLLVVAGGGWNDRSEAGVWTETERGELPEAVAAAHDRGATIAGVCTGGMVLSRAGLLDGRPAVTHGGAIEDLRATDATVVDARVVDDGDVLTCGGVTSGLDLAVHLVERQWGADVAAAVCEEMEYEPRGDIFSGDSV
ncbi:DJ-1/PfpI family protein [Haloarcula argentinensis]|uniref:DJ-1/PfpI family protein n=1 Tax=Haloarcula argentinensis TaxID=43776 RepID=A0ABU2F462_HALAR|nr:DJ-1/PfpI family protein [Haloarcula argentinensis]EMA19908.1 AraC family transcriptional regulator [Haloarcula argentinensis DSM 12282]MDS0254815.1 DJ-1/PfpI family protein [Haloarcula argentinensis]